MPRLRLPRLRFSLRVLWLLVTFAALAAAGITRWRDLGEEFASQQAYCNDLVRTLGGTEAPWVDCGGGMSCGSYSRPDGLEFVHETRAATWSSMYRSGLHEVTGVNVSRAPWNEVSDSPVRAAVFSRLARLPSLRRISIRLEGIRPQDLLPLADLPNVEEVTLDGLTLASADESLAVLGRMPKLRELDIDFSYAAISEIHSPEQLELLASRAASSASAPSGRTAGKNSTADEDGCGEATPPADAEESAEQDPLPVVGLSARGFGHLGRRGNLQKLTLQNAVILDRGLESLSSVKELTFFQCCVSRAGWAGLAGCRQLAELQISSTELSDEAATAIGTLGRLRKLGIFESLTNWQLALICGQRRLEELELGELEQLSPAGFEPLCATPIKRLSVSIEDNETHAALLSQLSAVPTLRELTIMARGPTFAFLPALADLKKLKELDLPGAEIPSRQLAKLIRALPGTRVGLGYGVDVDAAAEAPDIEADAETAEVE